MTVRRIRLTARGAQVRRLQDGFCYLEWDDQVVDSNAVLQSFVQNIGDAVERTYGVAPAVTHPGPFEGSRSPPQAQAQVVGDGPLTIQPPSINMGLAGMVAPSSGGGGAIVPAGIRPPPSPHGIGSPGNQQPLAVPGLPALPQPGISAPPPVPNMTPHGAQQVAAFLQAPGPVRRGPAAAIGSGRPAVAAQARQQFLDPNVVQAKIQADRDAEGPVLSNVDGRVLQTDPSVPVLPQPGILAPPPPPVIQGRLLGADGQRIVHSATIDATSAYPVALEQLPSPASDAAEDETRPDESSEAPAT